MMLATVRPYVRPRLHVSQYINDHKQKLNNEANEANEAKSIYFIN